MAGLFKLNDEDRRALAEAATSFSGQPVFLDAIRSLYDEFEQARAVRQPRCDASGACCRFEAHGHRLFVTTAELAAFLTVPPTGQQSAWDGTGCPYQVEGLCAARAMRPFGCRVYYCDRSSDPWQHEHYERFQIAIRELHERFGVPYLYAEWREALAAVGLPASMPSTSEAAGGEAVGNRRFVLTVVPGGR